MRTKNVQKILDCSDLLAVPSSFVRRKDQRLQTGDILVSSANSWNLVGKCCWVPHLSWPATFGGFISALRAGSDKVDQRYLYWWFSSSYVQALVRSYGQKTTNISNLNIERCLKLELPLPSMTEQRRIAAILDKADALCAKRREALAALEDLGQSLFLDTFGNPATNPKGWPMRTVGDLLCSASYGTNEKASEDGQFPVLRMNNITKKGAIDLADLKYMNLEAKSKDRYLVQAGDVLFNRTNSADLVGKTALFRERTPMAYAGYLIRLRTNSNNDPEYLSAFLNSAYSKKVLRGMCKSIIGMANINATELQAIIIGQPPLSLQREFAKHIGKLIMCQEVHKRTLLALDNLFSSLQHRAFTGTL